MGNQLFISIVPFFLILSVACLIIVLRYKQEFVARPLIVYLGLTIWFLVTNSCELLFPNYAVKIFFAKLEYISAMFIPLTLFAFSLRYAGYVKYTRYPFLFIGFIIPLISLIALWTNDFHGLFWREIAFTRSDGFAVTRPTFGVLFWLAVSWIYLLITGSMVTILRSFLNGPSLFRKQSLTIVLGTMFPAVFNILHVFRFFPSGFKDFTPIGFAFAGILFASGIYLNRFLKILPVPRSVILDEIDTGMVLFNRDGFLIDFNKSVSELLELENTDIGRHVGSIPVLQRLLDVKEPAAPFPDTEGIRQIADRMFSFRFRVLYGGTDRPGGYVLTMNDITERVRQIEELSQLRTQMVQSEKLAMIGQIAAGVAHEINNPLGYLTSEFRSLRAMCVNFEALDDEWVRTDLQDIIGSVEDGLGRIESVVRNLVSFARHGNEPNELESYDLNQGIRGTLEICRNEYKHHAKIELDLGAVPPLMSLKNEINQVILNIVTNAAHAIKRGPVPSGTTPVIRIRTVVENDHVVCEISNNGPPIPEEFSERIFQSFFTTRNIGGTGLGLSISREIIEKRHGGRLELVSNDPVTFRIALPVPRAEDMNPGPSPGSITGHPMNNS